MILLQSLVVGLIGYGLGVGGAALFGRLTRNTEVAFRLPAPLLAITAGAITSICLFAAFLSIRKVMRLEPAIVFKS
jgi:putative ABC transport system permease protein